MRKPSAQNNRHNAKKAAKGQNRWKEPPYERRKRLRLLAKRVGDGLKWDAFGANNAP